MFGSKSGLCSQGQLVGASKACGFDYVFDTLFGADLTIMEEANELLYRIEIAKSGTDEQKKTFPLPMFTSCCPGWINLVEKCYPHLIPHLSSCRSPMGMLSSVLRNHWWPKISNDRGIEVDQSKLFVVAAMPCTAKKDEMHRQQFVMANGQPETSAVLTVRELARLIELRGVAQRKDFESFSSIPEALYDDPLGEGTGAAVIFGVTGGVMEAALRTAADVLCGKPIEKVEYEAVRGLHGIKKSTLKLGVKNEVSLDVAVCHQMRNIRNFIEQIEEGLASEEGAGFHFIEAMTCPGGCIGGGGMPQSRDPNILSERIKSIYSLDEKNIKRKSHENIAVLKLYKEFLGKPLSKISHQLLHTKYQGEYDDNFMHYSMVFLILPFVST
jgi:NADH-quinone oxidoreductase subunit G